MTEKEMIEEMYNLFLNYKYGKVDWKKFDCIEKDFFEFLYNAGYRKPLKGSVVLTNDEWARLRNLEINYDDVYEEYRILTNQNKGLREENGQLRLENNDLEAENEQLKKQLAQARKETAKEILQRGKYCMPSGLRDWIVKQYGVEE